MQLPIWSKQLLKQEFLFGCMQASQESLGSGLVLSYPIYHNFSSSCACIGPIISNTLVLVYCFCSFSYGSSIFVCVGHPLLSIYAFFNWRILVPEKRAAALRKPCLLKWVGKVARLWISPSNTRKKSSVPPFLVSNTRAVS